MISIELTNRQEIVELLDRIPQAFNSKAVRKLLKYAVKPMVDEVERLAPKSKRAHLGKYGLVPSGTLKASIAPIDMKRAKTVTLVVGPRVKGAYGKIKSGFYGMFVERGHKVRRGKDGKFKTTFRGKMFTGTVPPKPFVRPAWDNKKEEVKTRFEQDAKRVLEKEIARLTKKGLM